MPLSPGNILYEYRITRPLGQGAFGTVYLAQDTLLDRPVAIKELTAAAQADPVAKVADRLPENVLQEDPDLLLYYDNASLRVR